MSQPTNTPTPTPNTNSSSESDGTHQGGTSEIVIGVVSFVLGVLLLAAAKIITNIDITYLPEILLADNGFQAPFLIAIFMIIVGLILIIQYIIIKNEGSAYFSLGDRNLTEVVTGSIITALSALFFFIEVIVANFFLKSKDLALFYLLIVLSVISIFFALYGIKQIYNGFGNKLFS